MEASRRRHRPARPSSPAKAELVTGIPHPLIGPTGSLAASHGPGRAVARAQAEMRKRMESVDDLIEEAKLRTVWWALCIFAVSYFLTREHVPLCPSLLPCLICDRIGFATPTHTYNTNVPQHRPDEGYDWFVSDYNLAISCLSDGHSIGARKFV